MYGVQQELARHQMMLEKNHDEHSNLTQDRGTTEEKLGDIRDMYKQKQENVNNERKKGKLIGQFYKLQVNIQSYCKCSRK